MLELYFLIYRIPKMMSKLARERSRSPLAWSLIGVGSWIGAQLLVLVVGGVTYGVIAAFNELPEDLSPGIQAVIYLAALGAALLSVTLVQKWLSRQPPAEPEPPPPPPTF